MISSLNALRTREVTGKYHAYTEAEILHQKFEVDLDQVQAHVDRLMLRTEAVARFVAGRDWPRLEIFYEDLVLNRESEIRRIADFLDIDSERLNLEPGGRPIKQTPTDLRELLTNFDELDERYRGTAFGAMVVDAGV